MTRSKAWLAWLACLVSRVWILTHGVPPESDTILYARYGLASVEARATGANVYEAHRQRVEHEATQRGALAPEHAKTIEYPPLTVLGLELIARAVPSLPSAELKAHVLGANFVFFARFIERFRFSMFLIDAVGIVLLARIMRREAWDTRVQVLAATFYALCGLLSYAVLYDRLDLPLGALMLGVVATSCAGRHRALPLTALALAISLKLAHVLFAPAVLVMLAKRDHGSVRARHLLESGLILAALTAAINVPLLLHYGSHATEFVGYHTGRGLHVESVLAALALALEPLGVTLSTVRGRGSWDLSIPSAAWLPAMAYAMAVTASLAVAVWWGKRPSSHPVTARHLALGLGLAMTAALICAPVLSPQYLLWILPLAPLWVSSNARGGTQAPLLFLLVCAFTVAIFPWFYFDQVVPFGPPSPQLPTLEGRLLLWLRAAALVVLAVSLWRGLRSRKGPSMSPALS